MKILCLDTETTGLVQYKLDACAHKQPAPVSVGWVIADLSTGEITANYELCKIADDVPLDAKALEIHGLSREHLAEHGADFSEISKVLYADFKNCDAVVAYNFPFDDLVLRSAHCRVTGENLSKDVFYGATRTMCAMQIAAQWLKIPAGYGGVRYMKLEQAYRRIMGVNFTGAHNALTDAKAALDVFVEVLRLHQPDKAHTIKYEPLCLPQ